MRTRTITARKLAHYFEDWLGTAAASDEAVVHIIENGLPLKTVRRFLERGLSKDEVYGVVVNPRTLKHRRSRNQPLSREESERAVRLARILAQAQAVIGDEQAALTWLRTPKHRFGGRTPMDLISTEAGGRMVEQMLTQIDEGIFA